MRKLLYILLLFPYFVQGQSIHITTLADTVCNGLPVQFIATDTAVSPVHFQWTINSISVPGADSSVFISDSLTNGDSIVCLLTNSAHDTTIASSNSIIVTVLPRPLAGTITGADSEVCVGATITLYDTVAGGVWSASNTYASIAGGGVTGVSGIHVEDEFIFSNDTIRYIVANTCGSDTAAKKIVVEPLPDAEFDLTDAYGGSDYEPCIGYTAFINDGDGARGAMYSTNNNVNIIPSCCVGFVKAGTDYIYCIASNVCGSDTFGLNVSAYDTPTIYSITASSTTLCPGTTITLADSTTGDPEWRISNGNASFVSNGIVGAILGVDTITLVSSNACGAATRSIAITVNGPPPIASVVDIFCVGESILFADSTSGGVWSSSNTSAITVDQSGKLTGLEMGGAMITYSDPSTGCSVSKQASVYPTTLPYPIMGISEFCLSSSIYLSDSTDGGKWGSSNTLVASISSIGSVTGVGEGMATITYSLNGCLETKDVTVSVCKNEMFVYPNPARDEVTIYAFDDVYNAYSFINAVGQKTLQGPLDGPFTTVNVQLLAAGFYTIIISGKQDNHVFKFVKD